MQRSVKILWNVVSKLLRKDRNFFNHFNYEGATYFRILFRLKLNNFTQLGTPRLVNGLTDFGWVQTSFIPLQVYTLMFEPEFKVLVEESRRNAYEICFETFRSTFGQIAVQSDVCRTERHEISSRNHCGRVGSVVVKYFPPTFARGWAAFDLKSFRI